MNIIEQKKEQTLPHLYEWAETFSSENIIYNKTNVAEEDETEMLSSYKYVFNLVKRLENGKCSRKHYKDILFHINQINYNGIKIIL